MLADFSDRHVQIGSLGKDVHLSAASLDELIEFIAGDATADFDGVALTFRHLQPLGAREADLDAAAVRALRTTPATGISQE